MSSKRLMLLIPASEQVYRSFLEPVWHGAQWMVRRRKWSCDVFIFGEGLTLLPVGDMPGFTYSRLVHPRLERIPLEHFGEILAPLIRSQNPDLVLMPQFLGPEDTGLLPASVAHHAGYSFIAWGAGIDASPAGIEVVRPASRGTMHLTFSSKLLVSMMSAPVAAHDLEVSLPRGRPVDEAVFDGIDWVFIEAMERLSAMADDTQNEEIPSAGSADGVIEWLRSSDYDNLT